VNKDFLNIKNGLFLIQNKKNLDVQFDPVLVTLAEVNLSLFS
jgi:hypothetical protein